MTIREKVFKAVLGQSAQACVNQHTRNIHTLYAMPDGRVYWGEEVSDNSWDIIAWTGDPVAVVYQTGTGSCGCNCEACDAGDDPREWAGDDAGELQDELIAKVEAIEVGYFDDETEKGVMPPRLTKEQAAVIGAYTGFAAGNFSHIQEYAEKNLERPIFTHEFASESLVKELRKAAKDDFLSICYEG